MFYKKMSQHPINSKLFTFTGRSEHQCILPASDSVSTRCTKSLFTSYACSEHQRAILAAYSYSLHNTFIFKFSSELERIDSHLT